MQRECQRHQNRAEAREHLGGRECQRVCSPPSKEDDDWEQRRPEQAEKRPCLDGEETLLSRRRFLCLYLRSVPLRANSQFEPDECERNHKPCDGLDEGPVREERLGAELREHADQGCVEEDAQNSMML